MTVLTLRRYYPIVLVLAFCGGGYLARPGGGEPSRTHCVHSGTEPIRVVSSPPVPVSAVARAYRGGCVGYGVSEYPLIRACAGDNYSSRKQCSDRRLLTFIHNRLRYSPHLNCSSFCGTSVVFVEFDKYGKMGAARIVRSLHADADREILRVMEVLRQEVNWEPARDVDGNPVACGMNIPIRCNLQ
jgi:hypothetical protein